MKQLIINADDFASTIAVTDGILDAMYNGVVSDTSMLVNTPHLDYAVKQAKAYGLKSLGLHLTLTYRSPISSAEKIPSLVDESGQFYTRIDLLKNKYDIDEVEKEFRAQIAVFKNTGLELNHIDTHHHIHHYLGEDVALLCIKLAQELNVPIRKPHHENLKDLKEYNVLTSDYFSDAFGGSVENSQEERLIEILDQYQEKSGVLEIMSHPGYVDDELMEISSWTACRLEEMKTFTSPSFMQYLANNNIKVISFDQLSKK